MTPVGWTGLIFLTIRVQKDVTCMKNFIKTISFLITTTVLSSACMFVATPGVRDQDDDYEAPSLTDGEFDQVEKTFTIYVDPNDFNEESNTVSSNGNICFAMAARQVGVESPDADVPDFGSPDKEDILTWIGYKTLLFMQTLEYGRNADFCPELSFDEERDSYFFEFEMVVDGSVFNPAAGLIEDVMLYGDLSVATLQYSSSSNIQENGTGQDSAPLRGVELGSEVLRLYWWILYGADGTVTEGTEFLTGGGIKNPDNPNLGYAGDDPANVELGDESTPTSTPNSGAGGTTTAVPGK